MRGGARGFSHVRAVRANTLNGQLIQRVRAWGRAQKRQGDGACPRARRLPLTGEPGGAQCAAQHAHGRPAAKNLGRILDRIECLNATRRQALE